MLTVKRAQKITQAQTRFKKESKKAVKDIEAQIKSASIWGENSISIDRRKYSNAMLSVILDEFSKRDFIVDERPGYFTCSISW